MMKIKIETSKKSLASCQAPVGCAAPLRGFRNSMSEGTCVAELWGYNLGLLHSDQPFRPCSASCLLREQSRLLRDSVPSAIKSR